MVIEVDSIVTRTIGLDYIYFDLIFLTLWITFLIRKKYWVPIIWGFCGWIIYLGVDFYLWHIVMGSRTYSGPLPPWVFFMWFCFSPGFVQFSYVFVMFEKRNHHELKFWTLLFYLGWISVGILSQLIPINDTLIRVSRNMNQGNQRMIFTGLTLINLFLALYLKWKQRFRWEDVIYYFIVGTLVELSLELSLFVSGIRLEQGTWSLELFGINTLIEFNMGIIFMYFIWKGMYKIWYQHIPKPLSIKDFKHIKSNFNIIQIWAENDEKTAENLKINKLYNYYEINNPNVIESDLNYYRKTYQTEKEHFFSNN